MKIEGLKRVKDIGEIAYLKYKNIPLIKLDTYEKRAYVGLKIIIRKVIMLC